MSGVEQQLSDLLHRAPGEPPHALDPDAVLTRQPRRWRRIGPVVGAVAAVGVAVTVAVTTGGAGAPRPAPPTTTDPPSSDPKAAALRLIDTAMRTAPLPPGARRSSRDLAVTDQVDTSTSPNEVRRTTWWTAPGTLAAATGYVLRHRPQGMHVDSSGTSVTRSGTSSSMTYDFATTPAGGGYGLQLDYVVASYRSGVAIRVDTWTVWTPTRPSWSYAPATASTVDVIVVRRAFHPGPGRLGAPTVRRTLTGAPARHLAAEINSVPAVAAPGVHSCPPPSLDATDTVTFHTVAGNLVFGETRGGCSPGALVIDPRNHRTTTYLDGARFEAAVLAALGLPADYGYKR